MSADGRTLIEDQEGLLERWNEYFGSLLKTPSAANRAALNLISQRPLLEDLYTPRTMEEIIEGNKTDKLWQGLR